MSSITEGCRLPQQQERAAPHRGKVEARPYYENKLRFMRTSSRTKQPLTRHL